MNIGTDLLVIGGPIYAGKSTLAKALVDAGYAYLPFSDQLKEILADTLTRYGDGVTVEEITQNKARYRAQLQALGVALDFDTDPVWIRRALGLYWPPYATKVVLDCIRTPQQAETCKSYGFSLIWVDVPLTIQHKRAERLGASVVELEQLKEHPIERHGAELRHMADIIIDGTLPTEEIVRVITMEKAA